MQYIKLLFLIGIVLFVGCQKNEAVKIVEEFLSEPNSQNKLQFVRGNSDYLKNNGLSELINELPQNYIEIRLSNEKIDDKEIIVEVVLEKVSVGGNLVDKIQKLFVLKENENHKIDLDASFIKADTTLKSMIRNGIGFNKELRVYVTEFSLRNEKFISDRKVLMWLNDQKNSEDFYIINENLYKKIKNFFSKQSFAHLLLKVSYSPENDIYIVADSLIQKGWIKNK